MSFEEWLISIGMSRKSIKNYSSALSGSITNWAKEANLINTATFNITSLKEFNLFAEKIKSNEVFLGFDNRGKGMYKAALKHYAAYLDDITGQSISDDIAEINLTENMPETEKAILISARIGQGKFRASLIEYWQACFLTGFTNIRFLIASHIKPWRHSNNSERLNINNGLLLLPNYDKAFDLGYISFTDKGVIIISKKLKKIKTLGIKEGLSFNITDGNRDFLKFHRANVFEKFFDDSEMEQLNA